ncbi:translational GTPase TypA [Patescibacteria group bacterium]|nr:translational GTPase TypA [Patescibacteria group bacterium]
MQIRDIAIIAHVDHGKTTLVDSMLKQTHTFRENQKEMNEVLIMDSNDLEKEKGITILAKNTSVFYKGVKINIIDTPGHADFGGEVERVLNMADGAILLIDAAEGPMPQTKFVLKKALEQKLKIILLINKIDRKDQRTREVLAEAENLFLELADDPSHLNFSVLYGVGKDGKVFKDLPDSYQSHTKGDLAPLFEEILSEIPNAGLNTDKPFQMLVSTLDYDAHLGRLCIGRISRGVLKKADPIVLTDNGKSLGSFRVQKLYTSAGIERQEVAEAQSGDIIAIAGINQIKIGQTLCDPVHLESLENIVIEEPTIKASIGPNTSPFLGREGKICSSNQIKERLYKETETNLGLKLEQDKNSSNLVVCARGELHLAVLIETMRREGFELEVSKPQVIYKVINGILSEPYEEITIDVQKEYIGAVSEEMAKRASQLKDMKPLSESLTRFVYKASSKNLLGLRNSLLTKTRGSAVINSFGLGYFPKNDSKNQANRNGALISFDSGTALSYGIANAQERGIMFINPGTPVYEGMVVGVSNQEYDIEVNVCKEKKQTNNRSKGEGVALHIVAAKILSLEEALDFITDDEVLEVTPLNLRIRKKYLSATQRKVAERKNPQ